MEKGMQREKRVKEERKKANRIWMETENERTKREKNSREMNRNIVEGFCFLDMLCLSL